MYVSDSRLTRTWHSLTPGSTWPLAPPAVAMKDCVSLGFLMRLKRGVFCLLGSAVYLQNVTWSEVARILDFFNFLIVVQLIIRTTTIEHHNKHVVDPGFLSALHMMSKIWIQPRVTMLV